MSRFLTGTRYLILIPILGLAVAAACFFIFGGIGPVELLTGLIIHGPESAGQATQAAPGVIIFEVNGKFNAVIVKLLDG